MLHLNVCCFNHNSCACDASQFYSTVGYVTIKSQTSAKDFKKNS